MGYFAERYYEVGLNGTSARGGWRAILGGLSWSGVAWRNEMFIIFVTCEGSFLGEK